MTADDLRDTLDEIMAMQGLLKCRVECLQSVVLSALEQTNIQPLDGKGWTRSLLDYQAENLDLLLRSMSDDNPRLASAMKRILEGQKL